MLFLTLLRSWLLCLCCFQQGICRIPNSFLAGCLYDSFLLDWAPKLSRTNLSHTDEHAITKHVLFTHTDRCSGGNSGLREQTMTLPVVDNHLHLLSHGLLLPGLKMNGGGINTRASSTRFTKNVTSDLEIELSVTGQSCSKHYGMNFYFYVAPSPMITCTNLRVQVHQPVKTYLYVTLKSGLNGYIYNN